jgi:hypothetical protein
MKKAILVTASLLILWGLQSEASQPLEKEVTIGISGAYIPAGFDSDSDTYVIVNGVFQNGCYRWKKSEINNLDALTHEVRSVAAVSQGMCLMVLVPFQKEIRLGKLQSGKHLLRFVSGDGTYLEKSLVIE